MAEEYENPAAKALKKPNPFTDGSFDGTTRVKEGAGYNPNEFHRKGEINIIDGEEYFAPANSKITIPNPEDPNEIIEVDNTSRGTLGFVSNPEEIEKLKAQGLPVNDNKPLTPLVAELQQRLDNKNEDKAQLARIRSEKAVKSRCIMQNAPYNPPEGMEGIPALAPYDPNKDNVQNITPQADNSLGEVILDENNQVQNQNSQDNTNNQQVTPPAVQSNPNAKKIEDEDTSAGAIDAAKNITTNTDATGTDSNTENPKQ